jgi:hypothetical protein
MKKENGQKKNESKDKQCFIKNHSKIVQHEPDNNLICSRRVNSGALRVIRVVIMTVATPECEYFEL